MPIISVEIMKTLDEREIEKTTKEKQLKPESSKGNRSYSERVRAKWICCAFKLGFLQFWNKKKYQSTLLWSIDVWKYEICYASWYAPQS